MPTGNLIRREFKKINKFLEKKCEIPNDESDTTKGDVLFLIDSSTSMGKEQFYKAVKLVSSTVLNFNNIGPNGIQVRVFIPYISAI